MRTPRSGATLGVRGTHATLSNHARRSQRFMVSNVLWDPLTTFLDAFRG